MKREFLGSFLAVAAVLLPGPAWCQDSTRPTDREPVLTLPPASPGKTLYEAEPAKPVEAKGVHSVHGLSWTCVAARCTARGTAARPTAAQCKALAERVGPLKSCGPAGGKLGGTVKPGTAGPAPGLIKPAPQLMKPAPALTRPGPEVKIVPGTLLPTKVIRTARIVITGSPDLPAPRAALAPVTIRTARITLTGSPDLPAAREAGAPVIIRTGAIRIAGDQ